MKQVFSGRLIAGTAALLLTVGAFSANADERNVRSTWGKALTSTGNCVKSIAGAENLCVRDSDGDGVTDDRDKCPGTPKGAKVDADGCMAKIVLHNINFSIDSATLTGAAQSTLDPIAGALRNRPDISGLRITGHTDSTGSERHNQRLSERRAQSVANYLKNSGVGVPISASGMGEASPVADNSTDAGRAENRRVEINVSK